MQADYKEPVSVRELLETKRVPIEIWRTFGFLWFRTW